MLIIVEIDGGDALSNLTLFTNSFDPRGCSNEEYSIIDSRKVLLTHLLAECTAQVSFTAEVAINCLIINTCAWLSSSDIICSSQTQA